MSAAIALPAEALELREAASFPASPIQEDGTVLIHVIRPGVGRGRGRHLYEADMLRDHAQVFRNWKMYVNHQSPEAKRKAGGLPRDVQDLGGRIVESWWDDKVPADPARGWGKGAVVARARPMPLVREIIEADPEIIEASINAHATSVRKHQVGGKEVLLVEGIQPQGTVDWVTEAGAGGRVVALMESAWDDMTGETALLESLDDSEVVEHLRLTRPHLGVFGKPPEGGGDEVAEPLTTESLVEALTSEEGQYALADSLRPVVERAVQEAMPLLLESAVESVAERARLEATADSRRAMRLRDMQEAAHRLIESSSLPSGWKDDLKAEFGMVEGRPTALLDQIDEVDGEGYVVKRAEDTLRETVMERIQHSKTRLAEAAPIRVRGQGPTEKSERTPGEVEPRGAGDGDGDGEKEAVPGVKPGGLVESLMESSGIDPADAYGRGKRLQGV